MKFLKKSIAVLSLGFGFIAPSSCVPPDVQAACINSYYPQGTFYGNVLRTDGSRQIQFSAWDWDYNYAPILLYRNGQYVSTYTNGFISLVLPRGSGTWKMYVHNRNSCGQVTPSVPYLVGTVVVN